MDQRQRYDIIKKHRGMERVFDGFLTGKTEYPDLIIIYLRHIEGMTYAEIATELEEYINFAHGPISTNTVSRKYNGQNNVVGVEGFLFQFPQAEQTFTKHLDKIPNRLRPEWATNPPAHLTDGSRANWIPEREERRRKKNERRQAKEQERAAKAEAKEAERAAKAEAEETQKEQEKARFIEKLKSMSPEELKEFFDSPDYVPVSPEVAMAADPKEPWKFRPGDGWKAEGRWFTNTYTPYFETDPEISEEE